ncbi:DUF2149 domain-containing protein [Noviherbaspirillum sedimenti]|uniref:DUF2149 domain-containing protein n=1 Tax=Noviherbaspirillum sedimenti TaxID=2320865 RepID=A0A3A3FZG6_9BURK|nr:DUF2149 domain-containing protein [Noviherbaspirillum sedimenti]RJG00765.1 hypothetical protein D3878_03495 [Noviherbaspirillum sedimenti]
MSDHEPRKRLRLYSRLDARFDDHDEDPRASLVNLVDVMLVFACGLLAALAAGTHSALNVPKPVEKGQEIERPASGVTQNGSGYDRVGEVFRDPKTGKLVLIDAAAMEAQKRPLIESGPTADRKQSQ